MQTSFFKYFTRLQGDFVLFDPFVIFKEIPENKLPSPPLLPPLPPGFENKEPNPLDAPLVKLPIACFKAVGIATTRFMRGVIRDSICAILATSVLVSSRVSFVTLSFRWGLLEFRISLEGTACVHCRDNWRNKIVPKIRNFWVCLWKSNILENFRFGKT